MSYSCPVMTADAAAVKALVERELSNLTDPRVLAFVRSLLVEPRLELRDWDYGEPGQQYPCWIVLDDSAGSDTGIAYCESGFGPKCPWGLLFLEASTSEAARYNGMGMDSGWYASFLGAFFESMAATALPIWRVFEGVSGVSWKPIGPEGEWEATWERVYALRTNAPETPYNVHHSVAY
jgi:hypothetical protein